jgi:hypothetical protein
LANVVFWPLMEIVEIEALDDAASTIMYEYAVTTLY